MKLTLWSVDATGSWSTYPLGGLLLRAVGGPVVSFDTVGVAPNVGMPDGLPVGEAVGFNDPLQEPMMSHALSQDCPDPGANKNSSESQMEAVHS